ncbi:MAG TPA: bifunctional glutamate N-acetyltransferase/amino-acid acetyltransferase ArgJ [Candidatus Dormibacteraeota bacterium]|nr:bifunctional glutamate N-acetyltransferase/amino-acid acetyltransferase ArgJ [Candidatus Dormibacteraeota bacterium]
MAVRAARELRADARGVTAPLGFRAGVACADVRGEGSPRSDVALLISDQHATAAGVFTRNRVKAAPVVVSQLHLRKGAARAVVVNSGNANACTGSQGLADALRMVKTAADVVDCEPGEILVASTGVIGRSLPMERIRAAIREAGEHADRAQGPLAAEAIMTTDTRPKESVARFTVAGVTHTVGGMAKGAGMIHPDMATLLAFVTTDARIPAGPLAELLEVAVRTSFNTISIDGDTSTNDCCLILANGAAGGPELELGTPQCELFAGALQAVLLDLAEQVVADGEGVTKTFEVRVRGAADPEQAAQAARTVTTSPLVKTAIHGGDPNWGRVLAALGRSGADFALDRCRLSIAGYELFAMGRPTSVALDQVATALGQPRCTIEIDLGVGEAEASALGCDLTSEYVRINASYST